MIRSLKLALATLAIGALAATSAAAQDTTGVRAGVADKPTFATLVAAVNSTPASIEALKARTNIAADDVMLVSARELMEGQDDSTFKAALEQHASHTEALRAALGAHAAVKDAMTRTPGVTLEDVIAVDARPTGKVVVFYRGKTE